MPETKIPIYVKLIDGNVYETCGGGEDVYFLKGWKDPQFKWNCIRKDSKRIIATGDTLEELTLKGIMHYE